MSGMSLNAFRKREVERLARDRSRRQSKNYNKELEVNYLLRRHEEVTKELYGEAQRVVFNNGWFHVGSMSMHKVGFIYRIEYLSAQLHERELNAPRD